MKTNLNVGHAIALLVGILIPIIVWGVNIEKRFVQVDINSKDIVKLKQENKEVFGEIRDKLHNIELSLKDKKDKEE